MQDTQLTEILLFLNKYLIDREVMESYDIFLDTYISTTAFILNLKSLKSNKSKYIAELKFANFKAKNCIKYINLVLKRL